MRTNSFTCLKVGRAVLCAPQSTANLFSSRSGTHEVTRPACATLLAVAALFTHAAFAAGGPKTPPQPQPSSGTLVLSYPDAFNWGLTAAPSGMVYAVGNNHPIPGIAGGSQLVLGTSNSGSSWSVLDDFAPPGRYVDFYGVFDLGGGITSDPAGNLYVSGLSYPNELSNSDAKWYVRRSTDGGATWTTVDDFVMAPVSGNFDDIGIAADAVGNVYASACDSYWSGSNYRELWTIRKGVGGTSFSTVDTVPNSRPTDIFVHPTAGIFAAGMTTVMIKNQTSNVWLVRRSTDGGATWSNVDTFQLASSKSAVAMGIAANASGIYVAGHAYNLNRGVTSSHWIVRKSTNGGNSWTTVDDYQLVADNSSGARCIATDANGNLVVAGHGAGKWIVRRSAGGTGPWTTVDVFQSGGSTTTPNAIAADVFGNIFVGGNDGNNWLIKTY